ncbi:hypothetical protein H5J25_13885 [Sphingomonas aliaeris]|uniref:Uncharacterized protein n=1 Tax=Sphingomonas aliaeris TaxID=2759526 RepID=A0A974NTC4_9SPHN|nr:hypothetical protein [Sphingomonas aliaeris]QQV76533.1 hypothetical protein H5J25_13885 [Sphingomonas aliaeris]
MRVVANGAEFELGTTEATPTIGITDFSRRVTDEFGVTTVVERSFSRRLSVRLAVPASGVDTLHQRLTDLRSTSALWIADSASEWLSVQGFYKDFSIDAALVPLSFCTLTIEGLAQTEIVPDIGGDPAPPGMSSSLQLLQPVTVTDSALASSTAAETEYAEWSAGTSYPQAARVLKAATHRVYESANGGNLNHDPAALTGEWIDIGPTNRWAMFDQALGTATSTPSPLVVNLNVTAADAIALIDVVAATVRVQAAGYDETRAATKGTVTFLDMPSTTGVVTVTVTGSGTVEVGTLLVGKVVKLGVTETSPTAGITDYSRKVQDEFGDVQVVQRAWAKRMTANALIRTSAIDQVANRIAAVRARPSLWIGGAGLDLLTIYGFFKDFSIERGEGVSKLSLSVEGLSKAAPLPVTAIVLVPRGAYDNATSYGAGDLAQYEGSTWEYAADEASTGNAPPSLPATRNQYWRVFAQAGGDGQSAPLLRTQWSIDGVGGWHADYADGDAYQRQSNDDGASYGPAIRVVGESGTGVDGVSQSQIFRRAATVPATPTSNTGDPPPGWSDGPPAGTDLIWQSSAKFRSGVQLTPWSTPQRISGLDGRAGDNAPLLRTQWSVNGTGTWHDAYTAGDLYLRQSNDNGVTYGPAVRAIGEDGEDGVGADGISPAQIFRRSATVPTTPTTNTGNPPPGWSDGPPDGTTYIWQSSAKFRGTVQLTPWSTPQRISGLDGASAPLLRTQWSTTGTGGWHDTFATGDLYLRQSNDNGVTYGAAVRVVGEAAEGGIDGISPSQIFLRSATVPGTPGTNTGNPPPGWSDGPPAGTAYIWQSSAQFRGSTQLTAWSAPQRISGLDGQPGASAPLLRVQWSVNGTNGWHDTYAEGDVYQRQSNDNGATYGPAIRVVGEDGTGEDGISPSQVFIRASTVPPTPATNTGNPPSGWSDGPPAGTGFIWQSSARFRESVQLTPWTSPQRISGTDGAAGVSPSVVSLNKASLTFAADSNGVVKAGQQPQFVQANYKTGTEDHTSAATWSITSASNSASVAVDASGKVTITDVTGAGEATVRGSFNGVTPQDQSFNWTRPKDAPPPASATSLSSAPTGQLQATTTTYPASPVATLTISTNASGQLAANLALSYFANASGGGGGTQPYNFSIAAYVGYRPTESSAPFTGFSQGPVSGFSSSSPGQFERPDEGSLYIEQTQTGLAANTTYVVGFFLRREFSLRSISADWSGTFTVSQP